MATRTVGFVLIAIGVILAIISIAADAIGIGNQVQLGFGWKQQLGTAFGIILGLVGLWLAMRKPNQKM